MKYYAVKEGRQTGIFNSWEECEKQVKGFSNAQYKSFGSLDDAHAYLNDSNKIDKSTVLIAYIDGSYNDMKKEYGYGCILIENGTVIEELMGSGNDSDYLSMRNVAGEIIGCLTAIEFAMSHHYPSLFIYYDYTGIEKWANKEWKANKKGTIDYQNKIDDYRRRIHLSFSKVTAHSGNKYNEQVDKLAKKAVDIIE